MPPEVDRTARQTLLRHGGTADTQHANTWKFPPDSLDAAATELAENGYQFRVDCEPSPEIKGTQEGAAYLCLISEDVLDDLDPAGPQLAYADDGNILANSELISIIEPAVDGIRWSRHTRDDFWRLSQAHTIPEPIKIRTLFRKWPRPGGSWVISHDGREFITKPSIQFLARHGAGWTTEYQYREQTYKRPPLLLWGGHVISILESHGVQFADAPVYYLKETTETSS
ncbi:hypothetical protein [Saccharopolyspora kobensis]|nr:hypothetical protein [Saccharopolyspora kobensis]